MKSFVLTSGRGSDEPVAVTQASSHEQAAKIFAAAGYHVFKTDVYQVNNVTYRYDKVMVETEVIVPFIDGVERK